MTEQNYGKIEQLITRHIGAFAENLQHSINTVADGVLNLNEKMDKMNTDLPEKIEDSQSEYRSLFAGLDEKIDGVEQRLDEKIDGVEKNLRKDMHHMEANLSAEMRVVGKKIDGHEERISCLERKAA